MAEPISIASSENQAEQRPERPRYDPPRAVCLASTQQAQGQLFCVPFGSSDFGPPPCQDGSFASFCDNGTSGN